MKKILILNGPNLNLLGTREPEIYGRATLADLQAQCEATATHLSNNASPMSVDFRQSNHEGELIEWIHAAKASADAIIINAGALSHTSIAILDALKSVALPVVEVHLSNIFAREEFRHHSYVSHAALGVICGFGPSGYDMALAALARHSKASA